LEFSTDLWDHATAHDLLASYTDLLAEFCARPDRPVRELLGGRPSQGSSGQGSGGSAQGASAGPDQPGGPSPSLSLPNTGKADAV
ncbi:hypothetical protein G3M53_74345, partial [Streptomyces sp. SID7982]|nr:hypothetical protein [Streptomyces sp. SID7982]